MRIIDEKIEGEFDGFKPFTLKCKKGWIAGTFQIKQNRLCISNAICQKCFKELIQFAIIKYKTNKILIYNIMNINNWFMLKGFKRTTMLDPVYNEVVDCLIGVWITQKSVE